MFIIYRDNSRRSHCYYYCCRRLCRCLVLALSLLLTLSVVVIVLGTYSLDAVIASVELQVGQWSGVFMLLDV